ncbi:MAG: phenylalanine--tRNA ligase subunit alpha [Patescibacteria group bacterium]
MKDELKKLKKEIEDVLSSVSNSEALREVEVAFFGRKGKIADTFKKIKDVPEDMRKELGALANELKNDAEKTFNDLRLKLEGNEGTSGSSFDMTLPGTSTKRGTLHPHTQMIYALNDAFLSLGFEVYEGPEITSEQYAFDYLNFAPDHPARESMDTYWLTGSEKLEGAERLCLRPHLTGGSVRYMQKGKPPFRFVYPGRVFRSEATDAKHERTFYQYEALLIDKHVPFSAGKLMVETILERVFGYPVETRMRAGFFPFVEPGFEIDMRLKENITGTEKGEKLTQWMEIMPGGPPHPNVLKAAGLDPADWQGFYINIGLDRLVMMKHAIDDVRFFHGGDIRFLDQFTRL